MSKSFPLTETAREAVATAPGVQAKHLELSRLASEYGRHIHPCKACSASAPMRHPGLVEEWRISGSA
jgi:hypothetical protein